MLKEVKCLACSYVLYRIGPLDERGLAWGLYEEDKEKYESMIRGVSREQYLECPSCKKKNWFAYKDRSAEGLGLQTWIAHVTG